MKDKRRIQRYPVEWSVTVEHQGKQYAGMIRNISLGGAFVESVAQLKFGDSIRVQFVVPQLHESIDVAAEVRWTDATEGALSGVGIQFQGLRARHVWALQACFAGLQAASA